MWTLIADRPNPWTEEVFMKHQAARSATMAIILAVVWPVATSAVEGMYPMSELAGLDLAAAGLEVSAADIFNPGGPALVDGIVKLGGCTGSFVTDQGLILTNHHCAFRAIRDASSTDHDYLSEGFSAGDFNAEYPAAGYTVRITESYRDVSDEVLSAVTSAMDPGQRTRAIEKRMKQLSLDYEAAHPGKRAEVSEMFPGKSYVLFIYTYLKDVRLVYAPPQSIGNFGGEQDNWIWPRHAGDFSFMRAYTGPDGEPASYSPDNVPYRPSQVLRVSPRGVNAGDPVFICGYPGRTYRQRSSYFLDHLARFTMPLTVDWYTWQIDHLEALGRDDRNRQLVLASRLKGLHNTAKNYRGKLQGIARLDLIEGKRDEEAGLREYIASDPEREKRYGHVLPDLEGYYRELDQQTPYEMWLSFLRRSPQVMQTALTVWESAQERQKPENERQSPYMARNLDQTLKRLQVMAEHFDPDADRLIMTELLRRGGDFPRAGRLEPLSRCLGAAGAQEASDLLDHLFRTTKLMDSQFLSAALTMSPQQLRALEDPFLDLAAGLYDEFKRVKEEGKRRKGVLDPLRVALAEVRGDFLGGDFIPDANGTLRFTYGYVEGYSPRDAVIYEPLTTVRGLLEKETGNPPFVLPPRLRELVMAEDFGPFATEALGGVPVDILYSTDTTGGNSGSPVLDARGRVVGLNFDRSWEATINDFAWDHAYSRSIGVDIRYVLWVTWKFGQGTRLLQEMGISLPTGS